MKIREVLSIIHRKNYLGQPFYFDCFLDQWYCETLQAKQDQARLASGWQTTKKAQFLF